MSSPCLLGRAEHFAPPHEAEKSGGYPEKVGSPIGRLRKPRKSLSDPKLPVLFANGAIRSDRDEDTEGQDSEAASNNGLPQPKQRRQRRWFSEGGRADLDNPLVRAAPEAISIEADSSSDDEEEGPSDDCGDGAPSPRTCISDRSPAAMLRREAAISKVAQMGKEYYDYLTGRNELAIAQRNSRRCKSIEAKSPIGTSVTYPVFMIAAEEPVERIGIIFDWDDTLLPTWFIVEVLNHCWPRGAPISPECPFYEVLEKHAKSVREILSVAKGIGNVAIVTLSKRPWVLNSAEKYLPGLDLRQLLREFSIDVFYAREFLSRRDISMANQYEGVNPMLVAKSKAMSKSSRKICGKRGTVRMNVVSIGDSTLERDALKDVLWGFDVKDELRPICKTVKLMDEPTLEHLTTELQLLSLWLPKICAHCQDIDISLEDLKDLNSRVKTFF